MCSGEGAQGEEDPTHAAALSLKGKDRGIGRAGEVGVGEKGQAAGTSRRPVQGEGVQRDAGEGSRAALRTLAWTWASASMFNHSGCLLQNVLGRAGQQAKLEVSMAVPAAVGGRSRYGFKV